MNDKHCTFKIPILGVFKLSLKSQWPSLFVVKILNVLQLDMDLLTCLEVGLKMQKSPYDYSHHVSLCCTLVAHMPWCISISVLVLRNEDQTI